MSVFKKELQPVSLAKREIPPIKRFDRPQRVYELAVGHVVLAFENDQLGWWEAIILEKNEDRYTLAWDGCPDQPVFERSQHQIALLCPQVTPSVP